MAASRKPLAEVANPTPAVTPDGAAVPRRAGPMRRPLVRGATAVLPVRGGPDPGLVARRAAQQALRDQANKLIVAQRRAKAAKKAAAKKRTAS